MDRKIGEPVLRKMEQGDLQTVLDLINKEGWDYHISEMHRILAVDPDNSIVVSVDGTIVGAITVSVFGKRGILGHVIVREGWRSKGIGRMMMDHLQDRLDSMGVLTMEASALKAALPFYRRHGYHIVEEVDTYDKTLAERDLNRFTASPKIKSIGVKDLDVIDRLDNDVTGFQRRRFLELVMREFPDHQKGIFEGGELIGFIFGRENPVMDDIGPWVMKDPNIDDASLLFDSLIAEFKVGARALGGVSANNAIVKSVFLGREYNFYIKQYRVMRSKGVAEPFRPGMMALGAFEFG